MTAFSSRRFNQDLAGAKRAAKTGPVFVTDRGEPAYVLLSIEDYRRITANKRNIADMLAMEGEDFDAFDEILEEARLRSRHETPRPVDFD